MNAVAFTEDSADGEGDNLLMAKDTSTISALGLAAKVRRPALVMKLLHFFRNLWNVNTD